MKTKKQKELIDSFLLTLDNEDNQCTARLFYYPNSAITPKNGRISHST